MSKMSEDFTSFFALERKQFLLTGLYPLHGPTPILYSLKRALVFFFSILLPVSMIIKLLIGVDSLEEFADILYYLVTQAAYLCKLTNFVYGPGKLLQIEEHLQHPISQKFYQKFGRDDLHKIIKQCDAVAVIFRFLIVGIVGLYAIFPYLDDNKDLPFAGWIPVDINVLGYRCLVYFLQLMCVFVSAFTNGNMDLFTIYLLSIGIGKLKLIKECFRHVDYTLQTTESIKKANKNSTDTTNKVLSPKDLAELYRFHEYIIKYLLMVEELFSYGIFIQFLASIAVVCMTGFQLMITPPQSGQFVLLILYINCMMCQVIMYCWYGNEILFESDGLGESCYMSNWYEGSVSDKKFIFIMMERSKRQLRMTAGKFFTLSLPTLVMILKSSYSYFAVLQRLYTDI
ncbi:odorant receptor 94b-like [Atheta coriaria]|uniref:odorant receptor 94b-like n=1 Tax=Dalotia coriaria TaxID=877792 RepID=UPI0031F3F376